MKLTINRFQSAEFTRHIWVVTPEHGTAFEDVLKPEYWSHVSAKMRPTDRIEVNAEDGSYFAELIIIAAGRQWAKVSVLRKVDLERATEGNGDAQFEVKWGGPHHKYRVIRLSDGHVIKDSFPDKEEANKYIAQHIKTLAA